ncbi:MAG: 4-hydroxybenzoate octaprenyltransferase [Gemmatimonadetes bacterium]|nr:4-hydroxybenzoate octaprenyltransferase [Gemmatimonadota bacterium]
MSPTPDTAHGAHAGAHAGVSGRLRLYSRLVYLPHTLFALPFALVGLVFASRERPLTLRVLTLAIVAFTAARFAAMAFNRLADRRLDAANPRTRDREIPSGKLHTGEVTGTVLVASAVFVTSAALLNRLALVLAPAALAWVFFYSYTKRFTALSHLVLGLGLAIAPVGASIALLGRFDPRFLWIAAAVALWVAGFDTIYSLQDLAFDKQAGIHSLPSRLGPRTALRLVSVAFAAVVTCLAGAGLAFGGGVFYWVAVTGVAVTLAYERSLVSEHDFSRVNRAFFTVNGWMSVGFAMLVIVDRVTAAPS